MTQRSYSDWLALAKEGRGEDDCWEVPLTPSGTRRYSFYQGKNQLLHRISAIESGMPVTDNDLVCHTCNNGSCVNPKHLYIGTRKSNSVDMYTVRKSGKVLTNDDVRSIRAEYATGETSLRKLANKYNTTDGTIHKCVTRFNHDHVQ